MILREGQTPSGEEVRTVLNMSSNASAGIGQGPILVRGGQPLTAGRRRGDGSGVRNPGVDYVFGFAGNDVLDALTRAAADAIARATRASGKDKLRGFKAFRYGARKAGQGAALRAPPSRATRRGWMCAMSSPRSGRRQAIFTRPSIARGDAGTSSSWHKSQLVSEPHLLPRSQSNQFR